jgi:hypothetical protein
VLFISAIGQSLVRDWGPLGVATIESLWNERGYYGLDFIQAACDILPRFGPKEFFRPGQLDAYGNFNNVYIGGTYERPRLRLPGAGGIPDVTVHEENVCLYVPRHGRHTFVEQVDFRSGLGHHPARTLGSGPRYLVSDLVQFDFGGENGRMRLLSLHPGVSLSRIEAKTGFVLDIPDEVPETRPPTEEELNLLREVIDPLGVRTLETLSGSGRRQKLRDILRQEAKGSHGIS